MGLLGLEEGAGPQVPPGVEGEGEDRHQGRGEVEGEEAELHQVEGVGLLLHPRVPPLVF